ncbi:hypothetical protein H8E77_07580 [bacterium]|nr:hypothetical protein [bacterium]
MPIFRAFIAIPKDAEVIQPEVIASSFAVLEGVYVYPSGKLVDHNGGVYEEFAIDDGFYSADVLYPPLLARTFGSFYLRDTHLTCLEICPFQYNSAKKQLRCYWNIRLRIRLNNAPVSDFGIFPLNSEIRNPNSEFQKAPSMRNADKEGNVYYPTNLSQSCPADYLIISPDVFYEQEKVSDLASWRAQYNGFDVAVVNTSDIYRQFGGGKAGIRDFIKHAYEFWPAPKSSDGHLAYVLLVGDVEDIPTHLSDKKLFDKDKDIATDNWYACLSFEACAG